MKLNNLMKFTQTLAMTSTLILGMATPAHAGLFGHKEKSTDASIDQNPGQTLNVMNRAESAEQAQAAEAMLKDMSERMSERLASIDDLIKAGKSEEALTAAKTLLDNVRIKTGIDPKARLRESFLAPTVFPQGATIMSSLPDDQKDIVVRAVRDYRGGLYLDVMNLSKRTSLLYIKALHAEMKKTGGVTQEDRNKIIHDLTTASVIPMPVVDKKGQKITVTDEDVANPDHIYLFNREIKMYLLESKDLQIDEAGFDQYKQQYKSSIGIQMKQVLPVDSCLATASRIDSYNPKVDAQMSCFNKYFSTMNTAEKCLSYAEAIDSYNPKVQAQQRCAQKFN